MSTDVTQALQGIRVVELASGMAGELAGLILAQYGADVVKVEPPGSGRSAQWDGYRLWNVGKQRVALDLKSAEGKQTFEQMVSETDVLVRALSPAAVSTLSVGPAEMARINPQLIDCTITGFDANTPYADLPGWDGLVAAKLGRVSVYKDQGEREGPVFPAVPVGAYGAAQSALHGIFAALRQRERTGSGAQFSTSLMRGMYQYDYVDYMGRQFPEMGQVLMRVNAQGRRSRVGGLAFITGRTKDGEWIQFANIETHLFYRLMQALDLQDLYLQEEFSGLPNVTPEAHIEARRIILERLCTKTLAEWQALFDADGSIAYELIRRIEDVPQHPQVAYNQHLRTGADGAYYLTAPWKVNEQQGAIVETMPAPPVLIASGNAIWKDTERTAPPSVATGTAGTCPPTGELLKGVTILEMGSYLAGPYGGRLVAEYGARVIKIEPLTGDPFRAGNEGRTALSTMWGKDSISLNIKEPLGREILEQLLSKADVLFHNFRPGVAERADFGWETLHKKYPQLVFVEASSYGSTGPWVGRPAYDPVPSAITGCAARQGAGSLPPPPEESVAMDIDATIDGARRVALSTGNVSDPSSGLMVATGILYALLARDRTGEGCKVETTMLGACVYANSEAFDRRIPIDTEIARDGLGTSPLYRLYKVRDGWVFLGTASETTWHALSQAYLGDDSLGKLPFEQAWLSKELSVVLERRFADEARDDLEQRAMAAGVPCVAVVEERADAILQPWLREAGIVADGHDHIAGSYQRYGLPLTQEGDRFPERGGPMLGEQTAAILKELGYSEAEIAAAQEQHIINCWDLTQAVSG